MTEQHQEILNRLNVNGRGLVEMALTSGQASPLFAMPAGLDPEYCGGAGAAGTPAAPSRR